MRLFKSFVLEFFNHTAPRWAPIKFLTSELIRKIYFYFYQSLIHYSKFSIGRTYLIHCSYTFSRFVLLLDSDLKSGLPAL